MAVRSSRWPPMGPVSRSCARSHQPPTAGIPLPGSSKAAITGSMVQPKSAGRTTMARSSASPLMAPVSRCYTRSHQPPTAGIPLLGSSKAAITGSTALQSKAGLIVAVRSSRWPRTAPVSRSCARLRVAPTAAIPTAGSSKAATVGCMVQPLAADRTMAVRSSRWPPMGPVSRSCARSHQPPTAGIPLPGSSKAATAACMVSRRVMGQTITERSSSITTRRRWRPSPPPQTRPRSGPRSRSTVRVRAMPTGTASRPTPGTSAMGTPRPAPAPRRFTPTRAPARTRRASRSPTP